MQFSVAFDAVVKAKPMRDVARIIALAAVLIAAAPHARADDDPATALSGVEVVAKPTVTPLSGIDIVVTRATKLAGVEVSPAQKCMPPRRPADQDVPAPKLVSSYPANGQTVQPGYAVLRLTFDLPMACRGSLPQNLLAACFANGFEIWHESFDRRSLMIACDLKPKTHYELGINRRIPEHFQGLSGHEPADGGFSFETSDGAPVTTAEGLLDRDPKLAAMVMAAASEAGNVAAASEPEAAAGPGTFKVSRVQVQETTRCLPPRNPPDPDVPAPKLVSTFPAQGQTVRPGLLELRFTFDLPMACTGGVAVKVGASDPCGHLQINKTPDGLDTWRTERWLQTWDRRTMRFQCRVKPGKSYVVFINTIFPGDGPWPDFKGLSGRSAEPYELTFTASNGAPIQTQDEADNEDPQMAAVLEGHVADREQ